MIDRPLIYLDECVDPRVSALLGARDLRAVTVAEAGMKGAPDDEQLRHAASIGAAILTHNRRDFVRIHRDWQRRGIAHGGILIMPAADSERLALRTTMLVQWCQEAGSLQSRLVTWGELQYLLTQGLRPAGYTDSEVRNVLGQRQPRG